MGALRNRVPAALIVDGAGKLPDLPFRVGRAKGFASGEPSFGLQATEAAAP